MSNNHTGSQERFDHYNVVCVGSGAGGSTLAYQLSRYGVRVLLVERGDFLRPERENAGDPVGIYKRRFFNLHGELSSTVGGDTKFYGAALYRLREDDFRAVEHEAGVSPPWPFAYCDLEPYYEGAEALYRVHGSADGDVSEPPRRTPFPHPPIDHAPFISQLVARIERSGGLVSPVPLGVDYGPNGKCVLCPTCDGHYCQLDAKMDAEVAALRPALASNNVRIMTETECARVLTTEDGSRVTGVVLRHRDGEKVVYADVVAVCAGVVGTPSILRRSRTRKHPGGLGNASGCLGKYLSGHSVGMIFPFTGLKKNPAAFTKTFAINAYYRNAPGWSFPTGVIQVAGQTPFWEDFSKLAQPFVRFFGMRALTCFYMTEALPTPESGLVFQGDKIVGRVAPLHNLKTFFKLRELAMDIFWRAGLPVLARRQSPRVWHEVGTARLGADPSTSVVDANCQVHSVDGLFVVDASVLPSAGALNPSLTIVALALRAGDHIGGKLATRRSPALTRI